MNEQKISELKSSLTILENQREVMRKSIVDLDAHIRKAKIEILKLTHGINVGDVIKYQLGALGEVEAKITDIEPDCFFFKIKNKNGLFIGEKRVGKIYNIVKPKK